MADGTIKLDVDAEITKAQQNIAQLSKEIKETEKQVNSLQATLNKLSSARSGTDTISYSMQEAEKEIARLEARLQSLQEEYLEAAHAASDMRAENGALPELYMQTKGMTYEQAAPIAEQRGVDPQELQAYRELVDAAGGYQNEIKQTNLELDNQRNYLEGLQQIQNQNKSEEELAIEQQLVDVLGQKAQLEAEYASQVEALNSAEAERERQLTEQERELEYQRQLQEQTEAYKTALQKLGTAAFRVASAIGQAAVNGAKFALSMPLRAMRNQFNKISSSLKRLGRRLGYVVLQGLLFRNLRKYLSEFATTVGNAFKQNEEFTASLANLKGTFWAAFAPIIEVLTPMLTNFMYLLAKIITYISGLIGIIFAIGDASAEMGASFAQAGEDAKKANKQLASFDTIQNLDSGKNNTTEDIAPTFGQDFEEAYLALEKLRELFEEGDWFEIGKYVGEQLNILTEKLDDWINNTLYPKLEKTAYDIAQFINGFFVGRDWELAGKTAADAINSVTNAFATFFETLDGRNIGESIGEWANSFLENLDAERFATGLANWITDTFDIIVGFIDTLDWDTLLEKIWTFVKTGLGTLVDWAVKNFPTLIPKLTEIVTKIAVFLTDPKTVMTLTAAAIMLVGSIAWGIIKAIPVLLAGLVKVFYNVIKTVILAFNDIKKALKELFAKLGEFIKGKFEKFKQMNVTLFNFIKEKVKAVIDKIKEFFVNLGTKIGTILNNFKELNVAIFNAVKEKIKTVISNIREYFLNLRIKAIEAWTKIKEFAVDRFTTIRKFIKEKLDNVKTFLKDLKTDAIAVWTRIKEFAVDRFDTIKTNISSKIDSIKTFFENLKTKVVGVWDDIKDKADTVVGDIRDGIKTAINKIIGFINGIIAGIETAINTVIEAINKIKIDPPQWVKDLTGMGSLGFNLPRASLKRIPTLATGTVVNPGHEFAAILGDNRREQEIVSPLSTMKQALIEALSEYGKTGTPVILEIDGRKVATAVVPHINNQSRAYGRSVII